MGRRKECGCALARKVLHDVEVTGRVASGHCLLESVLTSQIHKVVTYQQRKALGDSYVIVGDGVADVCRGMNGAKVIFVNVNVYHACALLLRLKS